MCGRYTLTHPNEGMRELFGFDMPEALAPRHNIAPGQDILAVFLIAPEKRVVGAFHWGFVPSWAKDPASANRPINARGETVAEKPSFRNAFRRRRCLIPADGFYEWQGAGRGPKQPWHITMEGGAPFAFAGIWECWEGGDGDELMTCAIVTTGASEDLRPIHSRMPVVLDPENFETWLSGEAEDAAALIAPWPGHMEARPVATLVNKVTNDGPELVEPVEPAAPAERPAGQFELF